MSRTSTNALLGEYKLPLDMSSFIHMWLDQEWNEFFLEDRLKDINVTLSEWEADENNSSLYHKKAAFSPPIENQLSRSSLVTPKVSRLNKMFLSSQNHPQTLRIQETNVFRDISY